MATVPHVVVIGGGITGLTTAWALVTAPGERTVTVIEGDTRVGGKILTTPFAGRQVETGPDAMLARVPWGSQLLDDLGFTAAERTSPATSTAAVAWGGVLHPLPEGIVLGVPAGLGIVRSRLLSPLGIVRAAMEPLLPRTRNAHDSVGRLIRARFGKEVNERLVDPLLGGINAGDADRLSLAAGALQLDAAAKKSRSLLLGLRRQAKTEAKARGDTVAPPVFVTLTAGLSALVDRLAAAITDGGGTIRLGQPVTTLERDGRRWRVDDLVADAVVMTTPAFAAARLLQSVAPDAVLALANIDYASVAMIRLTFPASRFPNLVPGSGVLVPKPNQRVVTAVSFGSAKWNHWKAPGDVLLRASVGHAGNEKALELSDQALTRAVLDDLSRLLGPTGAPTESDITRWPQSFPQYLPGHIDRIAGIRAALAGAPGIVVTGAAFEGVGIPACIRQGREAAAATLDRLAAR